MPRTASPKSLIRTVVIALALFGLAQPAQARWLRAESPRFVVYSDGDPVTLRDYVARLEAFDATLRFIHGLPLSEVPPRKLDAYMVRDNDELKQIDPRMGGLVAGFYSAGDQDVFAVAVRMRGDDSTEQHEYTHHFMMQYFPYGYPAWLVEGYAEYFMTTTIDGQTVEVGKPGWRGDEMTHEHWLPLSILLTKGPSSVTDVQVSAFYGEAWVLTHYLMSDPARYRQLQAYMKAVGDGADPAAAMETVTGKTLAELQKTLESYLLGEMKYQRLKRSGFAQPPITNTELPPSANDLLFLHQRLMLGALDAEKADLLAKVRGLTARWPDDRLSQIVRGHAEIDYGDRAAGEAVLTARLAKSPDDVEALQLLARSRMAAGDADPARRTELYHQAGGFLTQAYKLDPNDYRTVYAYALTRTVDPGFPTENTLTAMLEAHALAPQVGDISLNTAQALMVRGRFDEAEGLLKPIANDPHGGGLATAARAMMETVRKARTRGGAVSGSGGG